MKRNRVLLYAIALLQGMVFYAPVATLYRRAQGVSIFQITLIESISLILCLLLEIPWGIAADKIGYRRTMIVCCGLYFLSKIVFWRADSFENFLLERILLSVVIAGVSGVDSSMLFLSCREGESQKAFGIYDSLGTAGLLAAAAVFSLWVGGDYRLAGKLTVFSYGAAAVLSLGLREVKAPETRRTSLKEFAAILRQTLQNRPLLLFLLGTALFAETGQTVTVFLNQLQYVRCGLSAAAIGTVYIAVTLAGLCGVFSACFTEKLGALRFGGLLYGGAIAACLLLALTRSAWISVGAVLLLGVSQSLFQPLQMEIQNQQVTGAQRATALSFNAMLMDSVGAGTNLLFGAAAKASLPGAFFFGAAVCTAGLLTFLHWNRRQGSPCGE